MLSYFFLVMEDIFKREGIEAGLRHRGMEMGESEG